MGGNIYVYAKYRDYSKDEEPSDKLNFESSPGARTPQMSQAAREFHATKKGRALFQQLKALEEKVELALKASDKAENHLRKIQAEAAADVFFKERHKSEIDEAADRAFEAKAAYEGALWDQRRAWYQIETVLQAWHSVKILPALILKAKKELAILEDRLKAAHENKNYDLCAELSAEIEDKKYGIDCWTKQWIAVTDQEVPEKGPEEASK